MSFYHPVFPESAVQCMCTPVGLMDNAVDDSDNDDMDELNQDQRGLQRPLHARQRPPGL